MEEAAGIPLRLMETKDKRQKVESKGKNPEQRDYRNVVANLVGRGQKHDRSTRCQAEPDSIVGHAWASSIRFPTILGFRGPTGLRPFTFGSGPSPKVNCAKRRSDREDGESPRP